MLWVEKTERQSLDQISPSSPVKFYVVINSSSVEFAGSPSKDGQAKSWSKFALVQFFVFVFALQLNSLGVEAKTGRQNFIKVHHRVL